MSVLRHRTGAAWEDPREAGVDLAGLDELAGELLAEETFPQDLQRARGLEHDWFMGLTVFGGDNGESTRTKAYKAARTRLEEAGYTPEASRATAGRGSEEEERAPSGCLGVVLVGVGLAALLGSLVPW